jgi:hypothetical protein
MSADAAKAVVRRDTEAVQSRGSFDVFEELFAVGSPGIPVLTGQNSLSRRARPLELLGRPRNAVLFSREFRKSLAVDFVDHTP